MVSKTIEDIKKILIETHGVDKKTVSNIKGKDNLINLLCSIEAENNKNIDGFEFEIAGSNLSPTIDKTNPKWTKYILSQLSDDEKDQGYPKTDGLRRLLEKEISEIKSIKTKVVQAPAGANGMIATVRTTIYLNNGDIYEAVADAQAKNLESPYDKHVSAIAETRAEGRCYRKALRLKNVCTKEEMSNKEEENNTKITTSQIFVIDSLCSNGRLNINVHRLLKSIFGENFNKNIYDYSYDDGIKINKQLTEYQQDSSKIPAELLGYSNDWK